MQQSSPSAPPPGDLPDGDLPQNGDAPYDAVVIGGGPAGCTISTLLAQQGHRVLLLEREVFPRFKVGESLIPATYDTLRRLGMLEVLRQSRFTEKHSVQFYSGRGRASDPFYFREIDESERSQTWQVLRSEFDQMMLDNARRQGVEAFEGIQVREVLFDGDRAYGVRLQRVDDGRESRDLLAKVVIDASGQRALLSRKLGLRRQDPCLRMAAMFAHYEDGLRDPGIDEGATLILHTEEQNSWFWYIPLPDNRVSVGTVGPIDYLIKGRQGNPEATFEEEIQRCPGLVPRLQRASRCSPVHVLNDFSYVSEQVAGNGWMLVGDACGFLDPMYSSGVLLALRSGELAADTLLPALADDDLTADRLSAYGERFKNGMDAFRRLVYAFYTKGFSFGRFLHKHPQHRIPIILILQGDVIDQDFSSLFEDLQAWLGEMTTADGESPATAMGSVKDATADDSGRAAPPDEVSTSSDGVPASP